MGLGPIRELLAALGAPQESWPAVLVTGTNGKGSTSALLAAMAAAAGYRTGHYLSPHLEREEERIRVDGRSIATAELASLLEEVVATAERSAVPLPTVFEAWTAAAFLHFARQRVDLAVVEAGMGGARDSTNACDPRVAVVTSVDRDHLEHLGPTLADVARDKAGVFRAGRPAVVGWIDDPAAAAVLRRRIDELGARPLLAEERVRGLASRPAAGRPLAGQTVSFATATASYTLATVLAGAHQARNLAVAVLAAEALAAAGWDRLDRAAIAGGARRCRWPGRLEWVEGRRRVLLDAAHNPAGVRALAAALGELGPCDLLFGAFADKDVAAMLEVLAPRVRRLTLTAPLDPRAWTPAATLLGGRADVAVVGELDAALDAVLIPDPVPLVVAGSLRLVGDVRARLRRRGFLLADDLPSGEPLPCEAT